MMNNYVIHFTFADDDSVNVGIIVGAVMGGLIVVMVLIATLLKLILRARKKGKPVKKLKPVLQTRNSEASLRYIHSYVCMLYTVISLSYVSITSN